jgi:predicted nucleic acid-binding protein
VPLPTDLAAQVPADDIYLFQTALAGGATLIVTSDGRLIAMVTNAHHHGIQMRPRDEFIVQYLNS